MNVDELLFWYTRIDIINISIVFVHRAYVNGGVPYRAVQYYRYTKNTTGFSYLSLVQIVMLLGWRLFIRIWQMLEEEVNNKFDLLLGWVFFFFFFFR